MSYRRSNENYGQGHLEGCTCAWTGVTYQELDVWNTGEHGEWQPKYFVSEEAYQLWMEANRRDVANVEQEDAA